VAEARGPAGPWRVVSRSRRLETVMTTAHTPSTGPHPGSHVHDGGERVAVRRFGHVIGVLVDLLLLYLINIRPGWEALPFLTADTTQVLGLVNASLLVGAVAELVYVLAVDVAWVRALGDAVTTGVGLAAAVRIWQVFPFDVSAGWEVAVRVLLGIAVVGSLIGVAAALSRLIRALSPTQTES
jgi:hypothetical protein